MLILFIFLCNSLFGASLKQDLDTLLKEHDEFGVEVVSLSSGKKLYAKNAGKLFVPASCTKLFTAAGALALLGPDFAFETALYTDEKGNLYLKGSGDPSLSVPDLEKLIRAIALKGKIDGDLYLDISAYDGIEKGPGWMWDDVGSFCYAPLSALMVNHSCVDLFVRSSDLSEPPQIFTYPGIPSLKIRNQAKTAEKTELNTQTSSTITISGTIAKGDLLTYQIPVDQPHQATGEIFLQKMKRAGIAFSGSLKMGQTPPNATKLVSHYSKPLSQLVHPCLKDSDNLYSDTLFKKMGEGAWKGGAEAMTSFLEKEIKLSGLVLRDGSGLTRYNLASPHQFVQLLTWIHNQSPYGPELIAALPIAGGQGSLQNRLTELGPRLRAKTGYMTGISSLCGYMITESGDKLAFAILANGFVTADRHKVVELQDSICKRLASIGVGL